MRLSRPWRPAFGFDGIIAEKYGLIVLLVSINSVDGSGNGVTAVVMVEVEVSVGGKGGGDVFLLSRYWLYVL